MKSCLLFLAVAVAGCGTKPNPASCADDHCSDPARPFCDEDGSIGGTPDTCIAVECMPGAFEACRGDNALHCSALGNNFDEVQCEEGCSESAGGCNECQDVGTCAPPTHIVPQYLPSVCDALNGGTNDLVISTATTIDTSVDAMCNGGIVPQIDGPEICVLIRRSISITAGQTLRIIGKRAVALVADASITVDGIIDVSADREVNGPGGGTVRSGTFNFSFEGGGGAGFKSAGGRGGSTTASVGPDNGGPARPDPATLLSFIGGAQAGGGLGGGGGGALMLVSCRESVVVIGTIDAGGGGGGGGLSVGGEISSTGGGSGGYVVIQGRMVTLTGQLFANGGGGGAGRQNSGGESGASGLDGSREFFVGGRGATGAGGGGDGGAGACRNSDAGIGGNPTGTNGAGAGGGGTGFLQIYRPANVTPLNTAGASPAFQLDRTVEMK